MQWLLLFFILTSTLYSAPAYSIERQFQQPDGTTFEARKKGDEYLHWIETEEGDILLLNKETQWYEYAVIQEGELVPSGIEYQPSDECENGSKPHKKIKKEKLQKLWNEKRQKELKRRDFEKSKKKQQLD